MDIALIMADAPDLDLGWIKFGLDTFVLVITSLIAIVGGLWRLSRSFEKGREADKGEIRADIKELGSELKKTQQEAERVLRDAISRSKESVLNHVEPRIDAQENRIAKIEGRLEEGRNQMARIEERLDHLPGQKEHSELVASLAAIRADQKATNHTVNLLRETIIKQSEDRAKIIDELSLRSK